MTEGVPDAVSAIELFDQVWSEFDLGYSHFQLKGIDWGEFRERYRPQFDRPMTPDQFADLLATALQELHDLHVNVRRANGSWVEVFALNAARNYTDQPRNRYRVSEYGRLGNGVVWFALLQGNIAYIRIDSFETEAFSGIAESDVEALFARFASASGMIIDVRPNAGGNEEIARWFASRFTDQPRTYGYFRFRAGEGHGDFGPLQEKVLEPSSGTRFVHPTACLIGQRNMSSAEWFVLMMDSCPNVTLVGDRTRGSSGNPRWFTLANGVSYSVPSWIAYRPDRQPLEDHGIEPEVVISAGSSFDSAHDHVVEAALNLLRQ
ncbi:MAG: S41 family peptidase [Bradymonadales bacterium]|nr:S41 family peptidase [Bradymonadales bacterium]